MGLPLKYSTAPICLEKTGGQQVSNFAKLTKMMKVAIAGTNGFARMLAYWLASQTSHQFIILSRNSNSQLSERGWQVLKVDYSNSNDLRYKLSGVDTVISTISGTAQLALIDAAAGADVRRFVPSEFEGPPALRPAEHPFDRGRRAALQRLHHYSQDGMSFTIFTCGIFYERFGPGGLGARQIGRSSGIAGEGDYIMNVRRQRAQLPFLNLAGQPVYVSMISAQDAARFVVAALELPNWPKEWRMRGDRMSIAQIIAIGEELKGQEFERSMYTKESLQDALLYAQSLNDTDRAKRVMHLIATAEGKYDFLSANLNSALSITPERFKSWMGRIWPPALQS